MERLRRALRYLTVTSETVDARENHSRVNQPIISPGGTVLGGQTPDNLRVSLREQGVPEDEIEARVARILARD